MLSLEAVERLPEDGAFGGFALDAALRTGVALG
jgi:hypothetical protein